MPILVRGLTLQLDEPENLLPARAAGRLGITPDRIRQWAIVRRSLDARRRDRIRFTYNLELALADSPRRERRLVYRLHRPDVTILGPQPAVRIEPGRQAMTDRPVIVGFGPAGMWAGLLLAKYGYRPLIVDRGRDVSNRQRDIMVDYYRNRDFNPESNLLFGEGGAGTYSDGKLYTRVNDPRVRSVLETLYHHGAAPDILIDGKPHIGSDKLPGICRRIRMRIESFGGEVRFGARLDDVVIENGNAAAVVINGKRMDCGPLIVAVGQSARDTLRMLARRGVMFEPKPFQLGVRIEHPQECVDRWQYGPLCGHDRLPPAEYQWVAKGAGGDMGDVFSFCMCPGGMILPTNESPGQVVTNGASRSSRSSALANSGLVVTINPIDVLPDAESNPLAALDYLEEIERKAFRLTGESYRVPAQRACDYVAGRQSDGELATSYPLGGQWSDVRQVLPTNVGQAVARAMEQLDKRLPGFAGADALIVAPETRASGPIRMRRDTTTRQSVTTPNLYPVGEGAGYAGGIVSAAIDGMKSAELIIQHHAPE